MVAVAKICNFSINQPSVVYHICLGILSLKSCFCTELRSPESFNFFFSPPHISSVLKDNFLKSCILPVSSVCASAIHSVVAVSGHCQKLGIACVHSSVIFMQIDPCPRPLLHPSGKNQDTNKKFVSGQLIAGLSFNFALL